MSEQPVEVLPADPAWAGRFLDERALLEPVVGDVAVGGIHHVGSTSVPGLPAKPIIDILVGVADLDSSRFLIEPLASLDYLYSDYRADEMHWFCKPNPAARTHHLHVVPVHSPRFAEELRFRDALRADPALAREYAELKLRLAAEHQHDREAYTAAKAPFILSVIERTPR